MNLRAETKEKYEQEVKKADEELFPQKKRIAHNFHAVDNSNKLFNQQEIEYFGKFFGVKNLDFENVQPHSKSFCAHKIKTKSFPLLKKSQQHMKYIRHNVKSASKQKAHLSSRGRFKSPKSVEPYSSINESLNSFQASSFESSAIKLSDDTDSKIKHTEKHYQQGIAEIVKSHERLKCFSDRNINTSYIRDAPNENVLGNSENDEKSRCDKWTEYYSKTIDKKNCSFKNNSDQSNCSIKNKMKSESKYKNNSFKYEGSKNKASKSIKNYHNNRSENKCSNKSKGKGNKKRKSNVNANQMSMDKHKTAHINHKNDKTLIKKQKRKVDPIIKGSCQDSFNLLKKIKTQPCHVVIEECPEISHLLSSNSITMKIGSQNLTINKKSLSGTVKDLSLISFEGPQNIPEILVEDGGFSDKCDTELAISITSTDNITDSTDEIMVIEHSNNLKCKISRVFSTSTFKVKQESDVVEQTFAEEKNEPEKTIVPLPDLMDLSDEDSKTEILEAISDKSYSSPRSAQGFDKNNLNCLSTSTEQFESEACHKDFKVPQEYVNAILIEDKASSSLSKLNLHLNLTETDISKRSVKLNKQIKSSQLSAFDADKVKSQNALKYEDAENEIDDNAISKILDFENVVQPTISSLLNLFEKESQDLKNVQFTVKSYSNVAIGLKMLEQEKLTRLKYIKCALKKYQESKKKFDKNAGIYPNSLSMFGVNNIKSVEPFINDLDDSKSEKEIDKKTHVDLSSKPILNTEKVMYNSMPKVLKVHKILCESVPDVSNFIQEYAQNSNSISSLDFKIRQVSGVPNVDLRSNTSFNNPNNALNLIEQRKPVLLNSYEPLNETVPLCNSKGNCICYMSSKIERNNITIKTDNLSEKQSIISQAVFPYAVNHATRTHYQKPSPSYASSNSHSLNSHLILSLDSMLQQPKDAGQSSHHQKPPPPYASTNINSLNSHQILPFVSMLQQSKDVSQKTSKATILDESKENYLHRNQVFNKGMTPVGRFCEVCGKRAVFACQGCSIVFFCSNECGENFWTRGHSEMC